MDVVVEGIVDRIHGINWRVRKMLDETLEPYGLASGDWKVLSTLRWAGKPYRRSAGELARSADLSSGAMTNRLDQLEKAGFVERVRDPDDGRGILVRADPAGPARPSRGDRCAGREGSAPRRGADRAREGAARGAPAPSDAHPGEARAEELKHAGHGPAVHRRRARAPVWGDIVAPHWMPFQGVPFYASSAGVVGTNLRIGLRQGGSSPPTSSRNGGYVVGHRALRRRRRGRPSGSCRERSRREQSGSDR